MQPKYNIGQEVFYVENLGTTKTIKKAKVLTIVIYKDDLEYELDINSTQSLEENQLFEAQQDAINSVLGNSENTAQ